MKQFILLLLVAIGFQLNAQTHHIGLNFGVNQLLSIDEDPPFGGGSPWESKLGFGYGLSYNYTFNNGLTLGLDLNHLTLRFKEYDASRIVEGYDERVVADAVLFTYYYASGLDVGYNWRFSNLFSLQLKFGPSFIYYYKQKSLLEGYSETLYIADFDFSKDRIYYGINLNIKQSYTVYQDWNYRINLTATWRNTYIFDYLQFKNSIDRILPQAYLGVELELGRKRP